MGQVQKIIYTIFILLLVSPVLPLLLAWVRLFRRGVADIPRALLLFLALLSCSCALVIAALFFKGVIGHSYGTQRLAIIGTNWLLALLGVVVVAAQGANKLKTPLLISSGLLLVIWSLNAALGAVA